VRRLQSIYQELLTGDQIEFVQNQHQTILYLSEFLEDNTGKFRKYIKNIFKRKVAKNCFYLHGKVGVGKTFIINLAYDSISKKAKKKIHFHDFMIDIHDKLHQLRKENSNKDKLISKLAKDLSHDIDFLFFDEFQVTNIADAMILGHLFEQLFENNVFIILTTNSHPDHLYKEGLQRELFIPFIEMIKSKSVVIDIDIEQDFRKKNISNSQAFYPSNENVTKLKIDDIYNHLIGSEPVNDKKVEFKKRTFVIKRLANRVARFTFNDLCGSSTSPEDFINLVSHIDTIIIEGIPDFGNDNINEQERFINLIDVLYDREINLLMSSMSSVEKMKSSTKLNEKFKRTKSRLIEMKSKFKV